MSLLYKANDTSGKKILAMTGNDDEVVLAHLDIGDCPGGKVLDWMEPDKEIEHKYFQGWIDPLWKDRIPWEVREDGSRKVLENFADGKTGCLITGEALWQDYQVGASLRQILPVGTSGKSGVVIRYQDNRHFYFCGIEDSNSLVLYRRQDETWTELGRLTLPLDRSQYYELSVNVSGNRFTCSLDGEEMFGAVDSVSSSGKAGIFTNTRCRYEWVEVRMSKPQHSAFLITRDKRQRELDELWERYPKAKLWRKIPLGDYACYGWKFGDLRGTGKMDILFPQCSATGCNCCLTALDLKGRIIWQVGQPVPENRFRHMGDAQIYDVDGDGKTEVVTVMDGNLVLLEGANGRIKLSKPLPQASPYPSAEKGEFRGQALRTAGIYIANLRGEAETSQILLKAPYRGVWCYDHRLELLWEIPWIDYGHHFSFWDFDGDGREEAMIGYYLVNGNGEIIWSLEGSEYFLHGRNHADNVIAGEIDGDPSDGPEVAFVASEMGFILANAQGKIRAHTRIGHAQTHNAANFRPDLPGLEMWTCTRWGNYGIRTLFSGRGEKLFSFEPDNGENAGLPTNWTGDGEELAFHFTTPEVFGLYDAWGRKVVEIPDDGHPALQPDEYRTITGSHMIRNVHARAIDLVGDPRDELVIADNTVMYIYTQDRPFSGSNRIYAPIRKWHQQTQGYLSQSNWANLETAKQ